MAERKAAIGRAPDRPELRALLDRARSVTLTEEELREQEVSFVYGNAPKDSGITKESAREAVDRIRIGKLPGQGAGLARTLDDGNREVDALGRMEPPAGRTGDRRPSCKKLIRGDGPSANVAPE